MLRVGGQVCESGAQPMVYPAGTRGEVNPRSDRNRQQLEATARNLRSSCQAGAPHLQMGSAPGQVHSRPAADEGARKRPLELDAGPHVSRDTGPLPGAQPRQSALAATAVHPWAL